jgi:hypothetical protein
MYGSSYMFRHYIAIFRKPSYCLLRDAQLRSSRQNIVDGHVVSSDVVRGDLRYTCACVCMINPALMLRHVSL